MLFVIAAPSGAGKTTIVKEILNQIPELVFSVSATTRKKRENEKEGVDYFFFTKEEFQNMIEKDELVEYEIIFKGDYYGTLRKPVEENTMKGINMVFDVDVKGALAIKKLYGDDSVLIFIKPPDNDTLKERLKKRATESAEQINERIKRVDLEIAKAKEFDYIVLNQNLEKAIAEVKQIILSKINK
ncbi:MAG TPA: guanylate kinase [Ignavibacteria bacterium]|nr:guanylate kinase [Bacteroidota bacterium]HRI85381.1 guanylate kinase [Ignavibacteria bacterium]HRJ99576.1 guanylate kinase [Ignavibacteria bacterium]